MAKRKCSPQPRLLVPAAIILIIIYTYHAGLQIPHQSVVDCYESTDVTTRVLTQETWSRETEEFAEDVSTLQSSVYLQVKNDSRIFCETTYLGCYELSNKINQQKKTLEVTFHFMTVEWCITYCQSNYRTFASVQDDQCKCETNPSLLASMENPTSTCTTSCHGDRSQTCGGARAVNVYFIRGDCTKAPFTDEYTESRYKGCFRLREDQNSLKFYGKVFSISTCLLACEQGRHPLAVVNGQSDCLCGRMSDRFNLTHKLEADECDAFQAVDVYRTMADDERCSKIRLLPPGKHNRTLLASFPGSGNTWTRFLLERAMGYHTGSVYGDHTLRTIGFLGEFYGINSNRSDLIKDHVFDEYSTSVKKLQATILVIRNPYRAFVAYAQWMKSGHTGTLEDDKLRSLIAQKVNLWTNHWSRMLPRVLRGNKPCKVVYFEDMVADPIASVREMVEFLPNPLLHPRNLEERLACLSQDTTGLAKRKSHRSTGNLFSEAARKMINRAIGELRVALKAAGVRKELPPYEMDP